MADYNNERWNQDNRWAGEADRDQSRDRARGYREARFADEDRSYSREPNRDYGARSYDERDYADRPRGAYQGGSRVNQDIGYGQGSLANGGPASTRAPGSFSDYGPSSNGGFGDGYGAYGGPAGGRRSQSYGQPQGERHRDHDRGYRTDERTGGPTGYASDDILERQARGEDTSFWGRMFGRDRHEGEHRGRGPKDYKRSDQRISDDVHDRLTDDSWLDAQNINVSVKDREVTLSGTVASRDDKRRAEQLAEDVSGVDHVQNNLRVARGDDRGDSTTTVLPQV